MPIAMPTSPGFISCRFGLESNTMIFESPFTRTTQVLELDGARWTASYSLPPMDRADMAQWQSFITKLRGRAATFYGYDPDASVGRGVLSGTPLVNGSGQTGNSLTVDGAASGVTNWIRNGDYFTVNNEYKMAVEDANSNGSGQVTITFEPPLRSSPPDNAPLTVLNARCVMRLMEDEQSWTGSKHLGFFEGFSFAAVEVV